MSAPENNEAESDDFVIALSPKQLARLVVFIGFVVILTRARRQAGRI